MYLPALPTIAADLGASTAATQMTLTVFFVGFGLSQLAYGPVTDMVGRKPPLYFGLGLFLLGSIGCALAQDIEWLIGFRAIQGIGAASVMVVPRAVIRDLHTGVEATRLMALVMLVFSVSPILAPLTGSALIVPFGWRAVFVAVTVVAALSLLMVAFLLPETWPAERRVKAELASIVSGYGYLLRHARFLGLTFIGGLGMSSFFAFLASSSFIYIEHFGLSPTDYTCLLGERHRLHRDVAIRRQPRPAFRHRPRGLHRRTAYAVLALALLTVTLAGSDSLVTLMVMLFFTFAFLGLVVPTTMVLALDEHGPIAGMASALGGTLQMVTGGVMIVIVSVFYDGTAVPMVTAIALCAVGAFILSRLTLHRRGSTPQPAE